MRQAHIFYKDLLAGILTENDAGYDSYDIAFTRRSFPYFLPNDRIEQSKMTE